jgi:phosphoglucan,water dikinase
MIRIGNQTACWAEFLSAPFDYALAQGFDAFEWFPDKKPGAGWDDTDLSAAARQRVRDQAQAGGMRLSVHARWQANPLVPEAYPLLWRDLELARDLGAALFNLHLFHEQGLPSYVAAMVPLIQRTAEAGMALSIENTPHHSPEVFNELFARLRDGHGLEVDHVGMCLDLGHANLCTATHNDYLAFCDRLDPAVPILHLHLHENWGDADTHLPLFTGPAGRDDRGLRGLLERLQQRDYDGAIILEQWPQPPSLLADARDRLRRLWEATAKLKLRLPSGEPSPAAEGHGASAPAENFRDALMAGDRRCRSWREKLDLVRHLLARESPTLTPEQLIDVAVYLRFLGSGQIACAEDGRHFRPAHHARIAARIHERLDALTTPETVSIIRRIYPWLPSSAPTFQRPEPLTRIRDIAHRNDLDPQLKREIKTTLQNKLHRCAGPEDLATSSALLKRITAPGAHYSPAFVEQFRIFHRELQEFFNAQSLDERLEALLPGLDPDQADGVRQLRRDRAGEGLSQKLAALRVLTRLREAFAGAGRSRPDGAAQEFRLAETGLEDLAFVLLSEIHHRAEQGTPDTTGEELTEALLLALRNVLLSGLNPQECAALVSELQAWGGLTSSSTREEWLRLKATLLRGRRLTEDFSERTIALFSERAERLGRALGVADHAIRVFSESDIRSHLLFQVSKLVTSLLRRIRGRLGLPDFDVLVSGQAEGRVRVRRSLDALETGVEESVVLVLASAAGDEEVPRHVAGIIVARELPHLSHLAVRARQGGTVLVTCEEPLAWERLQQLEGQVISLVAQPDNVSWTGKAAFGPAWREPGRLPALLPAVEPTVTKLWLPLDQVVPETAGAKAAGVRRLWEMSRPADAGYRTPSAIAVPYGVLEAALSEAPGRAEEYRRLVEHLDAPQCESWASAVDRLQELVRTLRVPDLILAEGLAQLSNGVPLIVRSSSNVEDLESFAGAGLYESVMCPNRADVASAIRTVWASLWSRRAVLSRRQAGILHRHARMAVLLQELVAADYAFVLHTTNPLNLSPRQLLAEIVVGLGETLVSAAGRGSPYRFILDKDSGAVTELAFASFSQAIRSEGGGVRRETIDYSRVGLSREAGARALLGRRLALLGGRVEQALRRPQDIEGAVVDDEIFLVQARPQTGLPCSCQA